MPQTRRLQSRFTKIVLAYKKGVFKYVDEQQIMKSIAIIKNKLNSKTLKLDDMEIINSINKKMTKRMLASEEAIKFKNN